VAVNGLGGLEHMWQGFRAALPAHLSLRVLDLPGHGDRPPAADYRYSGLVADVAEVFRQTEAATIARLEPPTQVVEVVDAA